MAVYSGDHRKTNNATRGVKDIYATLLVANHRDAQGRGLDQPGLRTAPLDALIEQVS